jgi:putative aldouronate transport system substrate-binding protein
MHASLDRRRFLTGAAGVVGGVAGGAALAGCSSGSSAAAPNKHAVALPKLIEYTSVKPDLPAGPHGVPAGYFRYPADPAPFVKHQLGSGGNLSFLVQGTGMTPVNKNPWLKALEKAVKENIGISLIPSADYLNKFQVAIAGGNLQDVVMVQNVANMPQVLEKEFTDLSDYLSGDNIKNYPGLASIATAAWSIPMLNGRIWGVPQSRSAAGSIISTRGDTLKKFGINNASPELKNGQDFMDLCKALTDKKRGKFAFGTQPNTFILGVMLEMTGAPNGWRMENGKLTNAVETDEMKLALEQVTNMWKAGYIHPDSFTTPEQNIVWWSGGTTSLYVQSIAGWAGYARTNPTWDNGVLVLPKWNGGGMANKILGVAGYGQYAGIKKAKPARVKEILRVLDYFAAPFGTQEFLTMNFGAKGADYTLKGTDPIATTRAATDGGFGLSYCGSQIYQNIYVPGQDQVVKDEHAYLSKVLPTGVSNPTWGLYSQTDSTKGATAGLNLVNAESDIIQGRRKLSEWDGLVKTWRQQAGDKTRDEYEKAYASLHSGH